MKRYEPTKKLKKLKTYEPGEARGRKNTYCIYGLSGTGKTTVASTFPRPILYIDIHDDGDDSLLGEEGVRCIQPKTFEELEMVYWFLKDGNHKFKTVVIDTVTEIQTLIVNSMPRSSKMKNKKAGSWGGMNQKQWGEVSDKFKTQVLRFRELEMHTVFLAQQKITEVDFDSDDVEDVLMPEVGPSAMKSVAMLVCSASSFIGNTFIRTRIVKKELKKRRITEYCMRVGPSPIYITKVRKPRHVELPDFIVNPDFNTIKQLRNGTWHDAKTKQAARAKREASSKSRR